MKLATFFTLSVVLALPVLKKKGPSKFVAEVVPDGPKINISGPSSTNKAGSVGNKSPFQASNLLQVPKPEKKGKLFKKVTK